MAELISRISQPYCLYIARCRILLRLSWLASIALNLSGSHDLYDVDKTGSRQRFLTRSCYGSGIVDHGGATSKASFAVSLRPTFCS